MPCSPTTSSFETYPNHRGLAGRRTDAKQRELHLQFSRQRRQKVRYHQFSYSTWSTAIATPITLGKRIRGIFRDVVLVAVGLALIGTWQTRSLIEGSAPAFEGSELRGEPTTLEAALQAADGQPLMLHFWATWCGICAMMDGSINAIAKDWPTLTIAYQSGETHAVMAHMLKNELDFPTVIDADGSIGLDYGVTAVPTTFIIKPDGEIAYRSVGYSTSWGLRVRMWLAKHFWHALPRSNTARHGCTF